MANQEISFWNDLAKQLKPEESIGLIKTEIWVFMAFFNRLFPEVYLAQILTVGQLDRFAKNFYEQNFDQNAVR